MSDLTLADVGFDRPEVTVDLSVAHLGRLAALLDLSPLASGDPLPLLWHWAAFTPTTPTSALGPDGHPAPSDRLAGFPRRMWGAGSVELVQPLVAGVPATRRSELVSVREVSGGSGDLVIATVGHAYDQGAGPCLQEQQTIVYRTPGPPVPLPEGSVVPEPGAGWQRTLIPDPTLLFRYSAVTFNTHRIHYDAPYAREVEGYPALVFQGPLSAQLLAGAAALDAGRVVRRFAFKATQPLFVGLPFTLAGEAEGDTGTATITRNDGAVAMDATYELAA